METQDVLNTNEVEEFAVNILKNIAKYGSDLDKINACKELIVVAQQRRWAEQDRLLDQTSGPDPEESNA